MKALSVQQPWALEINDNVKNLEFRTWTTKHRGPLLICASSKDSGLWLDVEVGGVVETLPLPTGCMMCVVNLVNVRPATPEEVQAAGGQWSPGLFAWVFDGGYEVEPAPVKGRLNLFEVPDESIVPMQEGYGWFDYHYPNRDKEKPKQWAD